MALKGYKTLIFGAGVAVLGFLETFDFTTIMSDPKTAGLITSVIGLAVMVLRKLTTTPVGGTTPAKKVK